MGNPIINLAQEQKLSDMPIADIDNENILIAVQDELGDTWYKLTRDDLYAMVSAAFQNEDITFTGAVVVPNSTAVTEAVNNTIMEERVLSADMFKVGSTAVMVTYDGVGDDFNLQVKTIAKVMKIGTNAPPTITTTYAYLWTYAYDDNHVVQFCHTYEAVSHQFFSRTMFGSVWTDWVEYTNTSLVFQVTGNLGTTLTKVEIENIIVASMVGKTYTIEDAHNHTFVCVKDSSGDWYYERLSKAS